MFDKYYSNNLVVKFNLIKLYMNIKKKITKFISIPTTRARKIVFRFTQSRNFIGQITPLSIGKSSFIEHKLVRTNF